MQPFNSSSPSHQHRSRLMKALPIILGALAVTAVTASWAATALVNFIPDNQPTGWITRPALSSNNLSSNNEVIYRPGYVAGTRQGVLEAYYVDKDADISGSSPWDNPDAATTLDGTNFDTGRKIVTLRSDGTKIPFRWSSLSTTQQSSLGDSTKGPKILNYIRGDRSNEGTLGEKYFQRKTVLGEILHSTMIHWNHGNGVKRLYVGANDGMLHVFNAGTGEELYAFVPSTVIPRLKDLTVTPYTKKHFVDGPIAVADVFNTATTTTHTLLAGGLGAGGRGLYMLDITANTAATAAVASEADAAAKIRWEINASTANFANLGFTYAMPRLTRLNNGTAAVIVGNGYGSTNGKAVLYIVDAFTGARIAEIDTNTGSATNPNGLSSPTLVDTNSDGKVDFAYAGDLDGNVWKFDLTGTTYTVSKLHTISPAASITTAPSVQAHPSGGRMVVFGTGRTLLQADTSDTTLHYVYGIWDGAPSSNISLLDQTLTAVNSNGLRLRYASMNTPNWDAGGNLGWRLSLPGGARVVGENPFINDNRFYFTSANPTIASTDATIARGENWINQVNYLTGGGFPFSILDINVDGLVNDADKVNGQVIVGGFLGNGVFSQPVLTDLKVLSLTLFNSNPDAVVSAGPDRGVSGGHFDFDVYYGSTFGNKKHVHEYDDKFNVTGVNMLAASDASFNLSNAITNPDTQFKVLVMNQFLNPASTLSVGGKPFENVKTFGVMASTINTEAAKAAMLAAQPTYTRKTVSTLVFNLPLNAFASQDWWGEGGDGKPRAGLIPTQTKCVNSVSSTGVPTKPGPNGERYNGSLTIHIIKASTPASALEVNHNSNDIRYGWRVKSTEFKNYVLADYTAFWHHDNGYCYGDAKWIPNPEQDTTAGGKTSTPAVGSSDPKDGAFVLPSGETTSTDSTNPSAPGVSSTGELVRAAQEIRAGSGRINWREVTRE